MAAMQEQMRANNGESESVAGPLAGVYLLLIFFFELHHTSKLCDMHIFVLCFSFAFVYLVFVFNVHLHNVHALLCYLIFWYCIVPHMKSLFFFCFVFQILFK